MPQIMPAPPLPPLEPLPLPHLRSHSNDDDEMKKFECAICFEYLNVPVYCGSCPVRFCKGCLEKVIVQDLQRSATAAAESAAQYNNTTPAHPSARCPHCRTPINHIQFDYTLQSEMNACSKSIQCPFEGCEATLTLKDLSNHEKSCLFLPLKCRYHQWGCEWSGTLSDLPSHEEVCELNKMKSVIERIRGGHWELSHVMKQYAGFIAIAQGMGMQNRQEILQLRDNAGDFWDVLNMIWEMALFPERFGKAKERWGSMLSDKGRGLMVNMLLVGPWLGIVFRVGVTGMQYLPRLVYVVLERSANDNEFWGLVDTVVLSLAITVMGVLLVACFYVDVKSPLEWSMYNIWSVLGAQPLMRDVAAVCMAMTIFSWMDFYGSIRGLTVWYLATILSLGCSSFVASTIEKDSEATKVLESARSMAVVVFGLRYGCLMHMCNFLPSVGAMLMFRILPVIMEAKLPMIFGAEQTECFLSHCSCSHAVIGMVAVFAITSSMVKDEHTLQPFVELATSMFALSCINAQVYLLERAGNKLATLNFVKEGEPNNTTGMVGLDSGEVMLPTERPSCIGLSVAAIFVFASVLIATI